MKTHRTRDWSAQPTSLIPVETPDFLSLLKLWFDAASFPVLVYCVSTAKIQYLNPACEKTVALPRTQILGMDLWNWIGITPGQWKTQTRNDLTIKSDIRFLLHAKTKEERLLSLQWGGKIPGHPDFDFVLLKDDTHTARFEKALEYRKHLESLILSLSTHFLNLHGDRVDNGIQYALRSLGSFAEADRSYIFLLSPDGTSMTNTHEWCAPGITVEIQNLQKMPTAHFPWFMDRIRAMKTVHVPQVASISEAAMTSKREWEREGIQSLVVVPMEYLGSVRGFLGFDAVRQERTWPDDVIALLRIAGELLINALERKNTDQTLQSMSGRYRSLFENAVEGIFQCTPEGRLLDVNPAMARTLGFESAKSLLETVVGSLNQPVYTELSRHQDFLRLLQRDGKVLDFEAQASRRDKSLIWLSINARAVFDEDGKMQSIEGSAMDISLRKQMEAQVAHDALHDVLTGLPNRSLLLERLGRALDRLGRLTSPGSCVLLLDLDNFKNLNDGMGHAQGDLLLVTLGKRLASKLPPGATLARLGGDEFAILLEDTQGVDLAIELAEAIHQQFEIPFTLEGQDVYASVSMGIVQAASIIGNPDEFLRDADTAMHQAKNEGRARHVVFDASMRTRAVHRLHLENDLRKAVERQEFFLVYQPIVELKKGLLTGFEALIRWRHPVRGVVPPIEFIPLTEESGLIIPLGLWVLEEACRQLKMWQLLLPNEFPLTMSVNISGKQFEASVLADQIEAICVATGVSARHLKLEVTESAIIGNPDMAAAVLKDLQAKGFQLSLDDFGTGYSSLSYLHRFPFHNLKIDRSFVMKLEQDAKNDEIVKAINAMAISLGMDVTAEGIETQGQWDKLKHLATPFGQGYLFSKPLSVEDATKWVKKMAEENAFKSAIAIPSPHSD